MPCTNAAAISPTIRYNVTGAVLRPQFAVAPEGFASQLKKTSWNSFKGYSVHMTSASTSADVCGELTRRCPESTRRCGELTRHWGELRGHIYAAVTFADWVYSGLRRLIKCGATRFSGIIQEPGGLNFLAEVNARTFHL
jgi:hypothetical protein